MKKTLLVSSFILVAAYLNAQLSINWARNMGVRASNIQDSYMTTDAAGNIYTTGYFSGTVDFDPGPGVYNLSSETDPNYNYYSTDLYITKFDPQGNLKWAKKIGEASSEEPSAITVDALGNVYITGTCGSEVDFDPGEGIHKLGTKFELREIFVLKLNTNGNYVWAYLANGEDGTLSSTSITVDELNNVYTAGFVHFNEEVDFDPGNGVAQAKDGKIYVLKLDNAGKFSWVKGFGGNNALFSQSTPSIALDASKNIYITGGYDNSGDFDPGNGTYNLSSAGKTDIYIMKLNKDGSFIWAKKLGSTGYDKPMTITVDATGNIYSAGFFDGVTDFDPGAGEFYLNSDNCNAYILKWNKDGNFIWAKQLSNNIPSYSSSFIMDLCLDAKQNIYLAGCFEGAVDFNPEFGINNMSVFASNAKAPNNDAFISKFDKDAKFLWAKQIGSAKNIRSTSITATENNIYLSGTFQGSTDFDPTEGAFVLNTPTDKFNHFFAKYTQSDITTLSFANIEIRNKAVKITNNSNLDFGVIPPNVNKNLPLKIKNTGTLDLILNSIEITGNMYTLLESIPQNKSIHPGEEITLTVSMKASNITGNKFGKLTIVSNDWVIKDFIVNLSGVVDDDVFKSSPSITDKKSDILYIILSNPTRSNWQINFKNDMSNYTYSLLNNQGILISGGRINSNTFMYAAQKLLPGYYYLHVNGKENKTVITLIKE